MKEADKRKVEEIKQEFINRWGNILAFTLKPLREEFCKSLDKFLVEYSRRLNEVSGEEELINRLYDALESLLRATDEEGWNCDGEDWEEQEEARLALAYADGLNAKRRLIPTPNQ